MPTPHQIRRHRAAALIAVLLLAGCSSGRSTYGATSTSTAKPSSTTTTPARTTTTVPTTTAPTTTATTVASTSPTGSSTVTTIAGHTDPATIDWRPIMQRLQDRLRDLYLNPTADGVTGYCVPNSPCDHTTGEALRGSAADGEHATDVPTFAIASVRYVPTSLSVDPGVVKPVELVQLGVIYVPAPATQGTWVRNGVPVKTVNYPAEDGRTEHACVLMNTGPPGDEWRILEWTTKS